MATHRGVRTRGSKAPRLAQPSDIASIYGFDQSDGVHYLVLELVEGETLADRLKRGPLSVEEAVSLARQIAEALEAAHEKGVIHPGQFPAAQGSNPSDLTQEVEVSGISGEREIEPCLQRGSIEGNRQALQHFIVSLETVWREVHSLARRS